MSRLTCLLGCLLVPALAAAQIPPESEPVTRGEPLVVTETPLTADAAGTTHVQLDNTAPPAAQSLANLSGRVANFQVDSGGAGSYGDLLVVRGLANTPYFSDPAVTVYFDDLPLGSSFTYPTGLFGFTTASLHRGPQATGFGRAGEGGVLVFTSAEPAAAPAGELRASYGNFNTRSAALSSRSAGNGNVDATVAASFLARDGYIENTQLHQRVDDVRSSAASARFRFRPTPTSEISLQLLGTRLRDGAQPLVPLGGPLYTVARSAEGVTDIDFGGVALKASFDTALGRLSATTSYTHWRMDPYEDFLVLPPPLDSTVAQTQHAWSEELRFASSPNARRAWSVGAWFSDTHTDGATTRTIPHIFQLDNSTYTLTARTAAVFGEVALLGAGNWQVTAGLRAEETRKTFDRVQFVPPPGEYGGAKTFGALLPKLTVSYAVARDTTASASVSLGTKSGGWSAYTAIPTLAPFDAERTVAFEVGLDTALANKTVKLAVRGFAYEIRNYQIERSFTQADYIVVNAPRARSIGAEFEATWHPVRELTFAATLGFTDITLREFTDPFTHVSYSGKRAPYAPTYDADVSATWRPAPRWFATAELAAVGKTYYTETEDSAFAQDARATLAARLGYDGPRWRVDIFGENLTDERYYSLIVPGIGHAVPGAPRTYGVETAVKW